MDDYYDCIERYDLPDVFTKALYEIQLAAKRDHPIWQQFRYKCFVSKSKGRGRKRTTWLEIELVQRKGSKTWRSFSKFPFDVYTSETMGKRYAGLKQEMKFPSMIRKFADRT